MARVGVLLAIVWMAACGEARRDPEPRPAVALGEAAAVVNDETISLDEVRRLCAATNRSPREALTLLVRERLLAQYAEAQGYGALRVVEQGVQRVRAQAVLAAEIEAPGSPPYVEARRQRLEQWLVELRRNTPVHFDEAAVRHAFAEAQP
jgi:hypothetical protein